MTTLSLLAVTAPTRVDPVQLFMDADIVVQLVMLGLVLASIWVWTIIVSFSLRMGKLKTRTRKYEEDFWQAENFDRFMAERGTRDVPSARVAQAAVVEWRKSTKGEVRDREGLRSRLASAMESQVAMEADDIAERLARSRRTRHFGSALRHCDRPVRGHSRGDCLQPVQSLGRTVRGRTSPLRRPAARDLQPPAGAALTWR